MNTHRFSVRGRIRLRARLMQLVRRLFSTIPGWQDREKLNHELDFWLNHWNAKLCSGRYWNDDVERLIRSIGEWPTESGGDSLDYATIRRLEARAHGLRILTEAQIDNPDFFVGKTVMDVGPGAVCFLEASGARLGIAIEPLAKEFARHDLLLPSDNTIYLPIAAEHLSLLDSSVDVVVSRNNLDHVSNPPQVIREVHRVLRPGGHFILIVHLEPEASITEPHTLSVDDVHILMSQFQTQRETIYRAGRTEDGATLAGVYIKARGC